MALILSVACNDNSSTVETEETTAVTDDGKTDLSLYTLVRSDTAGSELRTAVSRMRRVIKEVCGAEITISTDYASDQTENRTEYEIIVGKTNIPESNDIYQTLSKGGYSITADGTKSISSDTQKKIPFMQ